MLATIVCVDPWSLAALADIGGAASALYDKQTSMTSRPKPMLKAVSTQAVRCK